MSRSDERYAATPVPQDFDPAHLERELLAIEAMLRGLQDARDTVVTADNLLFRFMDLNGDTTGDHAVTGDYSSVSDIFYAQPPDGVNFYIERMLVQIGDAANPRADEYGNLGAALTNGLELRVQDDSGTVLDLLDGVAIQDNAAWASVCYDINLDDFGGGDAFISVRWTFSRAGHPLLLRGSKNERLELVVSDDFSGLSRHSFALQGWMETP